MNIRLSSTLIFFSVRWKSFSYTHFQRWNFQYVPAGCLFFFTKISSPVKTLMVEPLTIVIRNSLFPGRSVLQSTSYPTCPTLVGGVMHHQHQHQHPFFSSNLFRPSKGKEREEPCLRRVSQCREWSCCTTRNFFYCPSKWIFWGEYVT